MHANKLIMGVAFALALVATLAAAGHATDWNWALPGAIAAIAFAFLV